MFLFVYVCFICSDQANGVPKADMIEPSTPKCTPIRLHAICPRLTTSLHERAPISMSCLVDQQMAFRAHVQHDPSGGACRAKKPFEGGRQAEIRSVFFDTDIDLPPKSKANPTCAQTILTRWWRCHRPWHRIQEMIWAAVASYSHSATTTTFTDFTG